jgi:hypothetical protein
MMYKEVAKKAKQFRYVMMALGGRGDVAPNHS